MQECLAPFPVNDDTFTTHVGLDNILQYNNMMMMDNIYKHSP